MAAGHPLPQPVCMATRAIALLRKAIAPLLSAAPRKQTSRCRHCRHGHSTARGVRGTSSPQPRNTLRAVVIAAAGIAQRESCETPLPSSPRNTPRAVVIAAAGIAQCESCEAPLPSSPRQVNHVSRPVSGFCLEVALRDGHSSGAPIAQRLVQPTRAAAWDTLGATSKPAAPCAPIRFCSRWGLPCHLCCRARCALTAPFHPCCRGRTRFGGLLSVALSLGLPPAAVSRPPSIHGARTFLHRTQPCGTRQRPSGRLT
jgi:hypothetical protein